MNGLRVQRRVPGSYMCLRFLDCLGLLYTVSGSLQGFRVCFRGWGLKLVFGFGA